LTVKLLVLTFQLTDVTIMRQKNNTSPNDVVSVKPVKPITGTG